MSSVASIIVSILIFSFLIFVHELGHFLAAKLSGVQVNEFAMFMGPAIVKWKRGETEYSIRCIPIGGFCAMEGEDEDTKNPRSFKKAAWWKRLIILLAGSFMNFLAGVLIYAALFLPAQQVVAPVIVEFTDCCQFAGEDGLHLGDEILEIDGEKIYVNNDISTVLNMNPTINHDIVVKRGDEILEFNDFHMGHMCPTDNQQERLHYGFSYGKVVDMTPGKMLGYVGKVVMDDIRMVRLSLKMLFGGQAGFKDLSGPVGIVQIMTETATSTSNNTDAILTLLSFGAFIAINLAVMNLLPIPALDGGRVLGLLLTTVIEAVTRKKLNPKIEGYIHSVGMIILLALMALILFKDIFVVFKG